MGVLIMNCVWAPELCSYLKSLYLLDTPLDLEKYPWEIQKVTGAIDVRRLVVLPS